ACRGRGRAWLAGAGGDLAGSERTCHRRLALRLLSGRRVRGVRPPSPLPVDLGVPHDREDPWLEALRPVERVKGLPGADEALLKEVLGILPCEHERIVVQGIEVLMDQVLEFRSAVQGSPRPSVP